MKMAVDWRLRRQWYTKQGRIPPERVQDLLKMTRDFCQRPDETDTEHRERLDRQAAETHAAFDQRARKEWDAD